jgi:hypothetical protein
MIRAAAIFCLVSLSARGEPDGGVAVDGGTLDRVVLDVEYAAIQVTDAGVVHVVGGCWLDSPTCIDLGRERVSLKAEDASLKQSAVPPPAWMLAVTAAVAATAYAAGAIFGHH